jgi:hypothetical protein
MQRWRLDGEGPRRRVEVAPPRRKKKYQPGGAAVLAEAGTDHVALESTTMALQMG